MENENESTTVLIADDNRHARKSLEYILLPQGYRLLFATSGYEALEQAAAQQPDLVLLDVEMPGIDGFETCQRLRADPRTREVPVIVVTGLNHYSARVQAVECGADDFICKPFDIAEIRMRVQTITRNNRYRLLLDERRRSEEQALRASQELARAYDMTLEGWARALDLRDKETEGHSRRVTEMTMHLARALCVAEAEIVQMRRGALLHDIGKLGVPDAILHKPGPLTSDEWVCMRNHPVYAYEMLVNIPFLQPALDIPHYHHEKWDGSGYPDGLKGEDIPLAARIFAVVDVWDALTSDRPYRAAWSPERARDHIASLAGSHFDPRIAEAFLHNCLTKTVAV